MFLIILLLEACSLVKICVGQSTTPAPTPSCNSCFLAPGFTDISLANEEYLLFTAYSMTSAFNQDGFCFTESGASRPLQTPYSIAKPTPATVEPAPYSSAVATWFVNFLNVPDWGICGENGSLAVHLADAKTTQIVEVAVPTALGAVSRGPLLSASTPATVMVSQSSHPASGSAGLSTRAKAALGVAVAVAVLALAIPGLVLWHRYRKQRAALIERRNLEKLGTET